MADIKSTHKSGDTEEWLDVVFTRPVGYYWALLFGRLGFHPNGVTALSMVFGAAAGVCFFFSPSTSEHWLLINCAGVLLLVWANLYDSADGQLARMTGKATQLGRILDGTSGDIWYFVIYWALAFRMWNQCIPLTHVHWGWMGVILWSFDGFVVHTRQCRLADYYRNLHLFFLRGAAGDIDNYRQQKALYERMPWRGGFLNAFCKFFQALYVNYVNEQEKATPQFQRLLRKLRERYGYRIPESFCLRFRSLSFPILWCTNALTFNQRAIGLYVACLLNLPWLLFVVEVGYLGIVYFHMKSCHEGFCRRLADEL